MMDIPSITDYSPLKLHRRIAILTEGYSTPYFAKTAMSLLRYRAGDVVALIDRQNVGRTTEEVLGVGGNTPIVDRLNALADLDSIYLGIAPAGGKLPSDWRPILLEGFRRKLDVVSGLHDFIADDPEYQQAAKESGCRIFDVRKNTFRSTAKCLPFRPEAIRIHSVGQDCSVGKMVAMVELERGLVKAGHDAEFLATGQTGIMISGKGVPVDCVVSDFVNGAVEALVAHHDRHDFLLIEGQGTISHPAFSAVTAGLLHGCAPHGLIFCYEAGRREVKGYPQFKIPPMKEQVRAFDVMANLRHPCRLIGFAVNSRNLSDQEAIREIEDVEEAFGLPACDVYRTGSEPLVAACVKLRQELVSS